MFTKNALPANINVMMDSIEYKINQATISDLNQLREMDRVCFDKDQWPLIELVAVLVLPGVVRLKVEIGNRMAGFISADSHRTEGIGWITSISVLPEFRRQGIAKALMIACAEMMKMPAMRLSVRRSNLGAQRLYNELGYKYVDVWKEYYGDGEDALIMEKVNLKID